MEMNIKVKGTSEELASLYKILMELKPNIKVYPDSDDTPTRLGLHTRKEQILDKYNDYLLSLKLDPTKFQYDCERNTGYFGMVNSGVFICGESLSEVVGFTKGELLQYDTQWAVFYYHGDITITPLKPIRYNVSWDDINELGLVNGGKSIKINDKSYGIYLHTGDISTTNTWIELLSRLHKSSDITPRWGDLNDKDLNVNWNICEYGSTTWCQEISSDAPSYRVNCGFNRLAFSGKSTSSSVSAFLAWRPLLILNHL